MLETHFYKKSLNRVPSTAKTEPFGDIVADLGSGNVQNGCDLAVKQLFGTFKNLLVVLVVIVISALLIALLDYAFANGMTALTKLFS